MATALSVGVGVAGAAAALAIQDTPARGQPESRQTARLKPTAALTPAQNEQPLSPGTKRELSAFGTRLVRCLATGGVALGQTRTARKEIVIPIRVSAGPKGDPTVLATQMNLCDRRLGKPPPGAAVTIDRGAIQRGRGAIHLFRPKTCPLSAAPMKEAQ
jgi:hypothetical protein